MLTLFGFGLASFLSVYIPFGAGFYTIGYRLFISCLSLYIIIALIGSIKKTSIYMLMVCLFLTFYSIRLYQDIGNFDFGMSPNDLFLRFISFVIIPFFTICFFRINIKIEWASFYILSFIVFSSVLSIPTIFSSERLSGNDILNPITMGYYASFLLITIAYLIFKTHLSISAQVILFLCGLVAFYVLISTLSRGPLISLACVFVFELFFVIRKRRSFTSFMLGSIIFGLFCWLIISFLSDLSLSRLSIDLGESVYDGEIRVYLWDLAINKIIENPIFGSNVTTDFGYVHNVYLEALMATGFIGAIFLFLPLIVFLSRFSKSLSSSTTVPLVYYFLLYCIIAYCFSGTIYTASFLFTLIPAVFQYNKSHETT